MYHTCITHTPALHICHSVIRSSNLNGKQSLLPENLPFRTMPKLNKQKPNNSAEIIIIPIVKSRQSCPQTEHFQVSVCVPYRSEQFWSQFPFSALSNRLSLFSAFNTAPLINLLWSLRVVFALEAAGKTTKSVDSTGSFLKFHLGFLTIQI